MFNILIYVCLSYVFILFGVAFWAEKKARDGKAKWLRGPVIYTLSLSIYCTAWTFYGAVGNAARSGLEYLTIYLGPTLVMIGWWWLLRKLVRVGKTQRVTSIADLLSSRFGKSKLLAAVVTVLAVIGTTPYIALQLQSVTLSFSIFATYENSQVIPFDYYKTAFWLAIGLAFFTILFGTRNLDVNERHNGVVMAIAVEAIVKLIALLAVGVFVVWGISGGIVETLQRIDASKIGDWQMLISLFIIPIAVIGLDLLPATANPDLFVLSVPLFNGAESLAIFAFLGGFSSATSMVIVASIAVSTMVSNHLVMPLWLQFRGEGNPVSGDVRNVILLSRRLSIIAILGLGYLYYFLSGGGAALASIGLISFTGVAQVLPSLVGGLFWRGATRIGAISGVGSGLVIWLYTLFLPSFGPEIFISENTLQNGFLNITWLKPNSLFGITGIDTLVHAIFWSITINTIFFVFISLITLPRPLERLQSAQFVDVFDHSANVINWSGEIARAEDLLIMAQRILGASEAKLLFKIEAERQGSSRNLPDVTPEFLAILERELSGYVGAATSHAMVEQIVGGATISVENLIAVADETARMMEYSNRLEAQSEELTRTAMQLKTANEKLTKLALQKDAFLSQISHELRTPMTSILAFSQILSEGDGADIEDKDKYAQIINDEANRLTRLLDDLLDLSVLENGKVNLNLTDGYLHEAVDRAIARSGLDNRNSRVKVSNKVSKKLPKVSSDFDRLVQVFINLLSNAQKYCDADAPKLEIKSNLEGNYINVDFIDNGSGIPFDQQELLFEKFSRLTSSKKGGAGLGLAICREVMQRINGKISY
ncbi:MAG: sodium:solute symporter, partial [Rhodobacterales bacterium]|nr:sodium:solute symporter [Rhodobacterales bacterium]